jgi:hypothetical protein
MLLLKPEPRMCMRVPPARLPMLGFTDEISTGCPDAEGKVVSRAAHTSMPQRLSATMAVVVRVGYRLARIRVVGIGL